jgi:hypothetical protein
VLHDQPGTPPRTGFLDHLEHQRGNHHLRTRNHLPSACNRDTWLGPRAHALRILTIRTDPRISASARPSPASTKAANNAAARQRCDGRPTPSWPPSKPWACSYSCRYRHHHAVRHPHATAAFILESRPGAGRFRFQHVTTDAAESLRTALRGPSGRSVSLGGRGSNPGFQLQRLACCRLHHPPSPGNAHAAERARG